MKYRSFIYFLILPLVILAFHHPPAVSQTVEGIGSIVGLQAGQVTINWGANDGIKTGMNFIAYRRTQMVHPETGEFLRIDRDVVGKIEISKVFPGYSVGRFLHTEKPPQIGDLVELAIDANTQYPDNESQPEKGTITNRTGNSISFNMGKVDGVEDGLYFDVFRGSQKIGTAIVNRVSENSTMATIASGQQEIRVGDRVELADQQQADMALSSIPAQTQSFPQTFAAPQQQASRSIPSTSRMPGTQGQQPALLATITSIQGNKIQFRWVNPNVRANEGILAGVYHQEILTHPLTGQSLGSPTILAGQVRIDKARRNDGTATLFSYDVMPQVGDKIGYLTRPSSQAFLPSSPPVQPRSRWQSGSLPQQATGLNREVQNIQREIDYLQGMNERISTIERSMAAQQKTSQSIRREVSQIKKTLTELTGGIVPKEARLIPDQTPPELAGISPAQGNGYTFRVSDDFKVKVQVQDKTILVSMDKDSVQVHEMAGEQISESESLATADQTQGSSIVERTGDELLVDPADLFGSEVVDESAPFYSRHWKIIAGGVGALALLYIVYALLKRKKAPAKKRAAKKSEDESDAEGDLEEMEEDNLEEENVEEV